MVTPKILRERGKFFIFQKKMKKKPKPQGKSTQGEQPNHSFSLLKCRGEKRCHWGPLLPRDFAAFQHKRDVV